MTSIRIVFGSSRRFEEDLTTSQSHPLHPHLPTGPYTFDVRHKQTYIIWCMTKCIKV